MTEPRSTVYVVDDDPHILRSVGRLLRAHALEVFPFACARDFLAHPQGDGDACLVLDIHLPDLDGLCLYEQIAAQKGPPVVFITGNADIPMSVRAMKRGAVDFLQKPFTEQSLLSAVHAALERHHRQRVEQNENAITFARFNRLTPREREVMSHVVAGQLNKQIASDLGAAEKTIKVHRARVMEKMEVVSVADLVREADRLGLGRPARQSANPWVADHR